MRVIVYLREMGSSLRVPATSRFSPVNQIRLCQRESWQAA